MKAIVIGSGLSGLSAAIILARNGVDTTILERNSFYGGYAHCFIEKGYRFETSLHNISPGIFGSFSSLGITNDVKLLPIKSTSVVICKKECKTTSFDYTVDSFKAYLKQKYPGESLNVDRFFDYVVNLSPFLTEFASNKGFKQFVIAVKKIDKLIETGRNIIKSTAKDVLDRFFVDETIKDEIFNQVLYFGTGKSDFAAAIFSVAAPLFFIKGTSYIKGGSQRLVDAMVKKFHSNGGKIEYNCQVNRIHIANNRVESITTNDGKQRTCDVVLYCADLLHLLKNVVDAKIIKDQPSVFQRAIVPPLLAFYIGLNENVKKKGFINYAYGITFGKNNDQLDMTISSNIDPTAAPTNKTNILVSYFSNKQYDINTMQKFTIKSISTVLGMTKDDFVHKIDVMRYLSPRDFEMMTLNQQGSFGGFQYSNYNAIQHPISYKTLVKNLFLAGQWVGVGAGFENTIVGGINAAKLALSIMK